MVREEITFNGKTVADERLRRLMMTIMTAVFMTVGIVFTGIGGGVLYKSNQDTRKCTETVYGVHGISHQNIDHRSLEGGGDIRLNYLFTLHAAGIQMV